MDLDLVEKCVIPSLESNLELMEHIFYKPTNSKEFNYYLKATMYSLSEALAAAKSFVELYKE
jgi:hypothetical protein